MSFHVLIIGGGIGGLCLAQGLRKAGIEVSVFERDRSAQIRNQGFRFRIDPAGDAALQVCLPENLYELYLATSNRPTAPPSGAYNHLFEIIYRMDPPILAAVPPRHSSVNRLTLRQTLLGGLDDIVHFGRECVRVEQSDTGVIAHFADGSAAHGDVLIAADGIGSAVRRQLLPDVELIDTGVRCLYGVAPVDDEMLSWLPESLHSSFTPCLGPGYRTLAFGMYRSRQPQVEAAAALAPGVTLDPVADYMMWILIAPGEQFGLSDDQLRAADPETLYRIAIELTTEWHPTLRRVMERTNVPALFPIAIRTSQRIPAWPVSRVTFLGDAIHAMTPAGGIGANTALRDAALLTRQLTAVQSGEMPLLEAIGAYETEMRDYGFAAVEQSLQAAQNMFRIGQQARERAAA